MRKQTGALIVITCVLGGSLSACKARDNGAGDTLAARSDSAAGRVDSAARANGNKPMTDSARRTDSTHANGTNGWSDASILGYAWAANNDEVKIGQLAEKIRHRTDAVIALDEEPTLRTDHFPTICSSDLLERGRGQLAAAQRLLRSEQPGRAQEAADDVGTGLEHPLTLERGGESRLAFSMRSETSSPARLRLSCTARTTSRARPSLRSSSSIASSSATAWAPSRSTW